MQPAFLLWRWISQCQHGTARSTSFLSPTRFARHGVIALLFIGMTNHGLSQRETSAQEQTVDGPDTVFVVDQQTNEMRSRPGKVLTFNQKVLELQNSDGRTIKIPAREVTRVQTKYTASYEEARQQIAAQDYAGALRSLEKALREEKREWVLRDILAESTSISKLLGTPSLACESYLLIARNEPDHRHWSVTPIPWSTEAADVQLEQQALEWMASSQPVERLLGAAWLLKGKDAKEAERTLKELARNRTDAIGKLASAQLWRVPQAVNAALLDEWRQTLDELPEELQAGPAYLLGRALAQDKQHDLAAATFMQVRILHPECLELNAMSLFEAGRSLQASGHEGEAEQVYRELQEAFPNSFWAKQAPR